LQYLYLFNFFFENPKWTQNLLFGTLCQFIPLIGPIVFLGHQYEVIERLHRRPREIYPDFDFSNFVDYLKRGIWIFLVALVVSLPFGLLIGVMSLVFPLVAVLAAEADQEVAAALMGVGFGLFFLFFFVLMMLAPLVMVPMYLRAGLRQEFGAAFDFGFIRDFIRRVWVEVLLGQLFLFIVYPILLGIGFALCCVGIYPALVLWMFAHTHLLFQLYELYLVRGGQEIPLPPQLPPVRMG
jgi:hypothetical protein